jgi:hypothetical protein
MQLLKHCSLKYLLRSCRYTTHFNLLVRQCSLFIFLHKLTNREQPRKQFSYQLTDSKSLQDVNILRLCFCKIQQDFSKIWRLYKLSTCRLRLIPSNSLRQTHLSRACIAFACRNAWPSVFNKRHWLTRTAL